MTHEEKMKKEENTMIKIRLTQDAYACGGSVRAGHNSIYELTAWYEAAAEDADGNEYRVIWEISNPDAEDESDACDWSEPWAILDEHYNNVSDTVTLDGEEDTTPTYEEIDWRFFDDRETEDTMTPEEMWNEAHRLTEEVSWLITDDEAAYQADPTHLVLVDDIDRVRDAYYDDLENGYEDEDEDIYGFLDRHGIEWK